MLLIYIWIFFNSIFVKNCYFDSRDSSFVKNCYFDWRERWYLAFLISLIINMQDINLPHIAFSVCSLINGVKSFTTIPFESFRDCVIRLPSSIKVPINCCNILKWNVEFSIFRRECHLAPKTKTRLYKIM